MLSDIEKKYIQKAAKKITTTPKQNKRQNHNSEQRITKGVLGLKRIHQTNTSLPKTRKSIRKAHVCSDRTKKAELRLQIGNSFQTLADL